MSIIKHITLQKIVAHDFRYDPLVLQDDTRCLQYQIVKSCFMGMHAAITEQFKYICWLTLELE